MIIPRSSQRLALLASVLVALVSTAAAATAEIVPGTANPWLAGMPPGSTDDGFDSVPAQSPVLVTSIDVSHIAAFVASATGGVYFAAGCTIPPSGTCQLPDGTFSGNHSVGVSGVSNGIANVFARYSSLLGVFLDASQPDSSSAPVGLDFSNEQIGIQFPSLAPELKQPFFIGDGATFAGAPHLFYVPAGATRLFLGSHDGFGWFDNSGQLEVVLTPVAGGVSTLIVKVVYSTESIVTGPLSFGLSTLPASFTATIVLPGFGANENVVAGLADVGAFSLGFGDGLWTDLTSFSLVTDGTGEVTTLSYETSGITTPTVVAGGVLNGSFSATISGTDISSGQDFEYFYADSAQAQTVLAVANVPALHPGALLLLVFVLGAGGLAMLPRGGRRWEPDA